MIDIRRRFFLFGATAALVVPMKTIFVMPKKIITWSEYKTYLEDEILRYGHVNCRCSLEALVPNVPTGEDLARWAGLYE